MKVTLISFLTFLIFNATLFGQTSDFDKIFNHSGLKQLKSESLVETNFMALANKKTVILTSFEKGCKWILEEMAYYNKLKKEYPNQLEVFLLFSDDTEVMSEYIQDVGFDFIYIYDPFMSLDQDISANDTIFSVLFDSNGFIQEKITSGYLDHKKILNQLNGNQPLTSKKTNSALPILNFQLKRYELGDEVSSNLSSVNLPVKIMTGYKANQSIDTIENMKFCTLTGKDILGLYSFAYNMPESRFMYNKELNYIDSHDPDKRYTLILSLSGSHADLNEMLIKLIDLNFGLKTSAITKKTELLVLSKIELTDGVIQIANSSESSKAVHSTINETQFRIKADNVKATEISKLIEEKLMVPVELKMNPNANYSVDISIENDDKTIDSWIELFSESGIIIKKIMTDVQYVIVNK